MPSDPHLERLPFPTQSLVLRTAVVEEYLIPEELREWVLGLLYLFRPVPSLAAWRMDLRTGRIFQVREFRVIRHAGRNWLFTPFIEEGGGGVLSWVPIPPPRRRPAASPLRQSASGSATRTWTLRVAESGAAARDDETHDEPAV